MKGFLLDACALSEPIKPNPDPKFIEWFRHQEKDIGISHLFVSVLSLGEIQKGISKIEEVKRRNKFLAFLEETQDLFLGRILPIQSEVALCWGDIEGQLLTKGASIPSIDGLIAATAIHHGLTVVTRNVKDFGVISQKYSPKSEYQLSELVLNPWGSVK